MPFELQLARDNPREKPILFDFHGWSANRLILKTAERRLKDWNQVRPMDRYGYVRNGCWWLGENHAFFHLDLIEQLLQHLRDDLAMTGDLYAYGSSMGGFGALLHGLRHKFKAISVNVPQVRILGTEYLTRRKKRHQTMLATIWDESVIQYSWAEVVDICRDNPESSLRYSDATCFLDVDNPSDNPLIFISYSRFEMKQYFAKQCLYLLDRLVQAGCNFELFVEPYKGHYIVRNQYHAIELFEKYRDVIETPLSGAPIDRNINVPPPPPPRNHSVLCN